MSLISQHVTTLMRLQDKLTTQEFQQKAQDATIFLEQRLSKILNKKVKVKYLSGGNFGYAFKISVKDSEDLCLKLFYKNRINNMPFHHDAGIEPQTAIFVNEYSSKFTNFYFGRVTDKYSETPTFYVTKFISKYTSRTPSKIKSSDYLITNGDLNNENQIKGTTIDFGGTFVYKNGINLTELDE